MIHAEPLAAVLGARAIAMPSAHQPAPVAMVLPDGRVPAVVREFAHIIWVSTADSRSWSFKPKQLDEATQTEIVEAIQSWERSPASALPSLYAIGLALAETLSAALGERWTIELPGVIEPREAWLHGPEADAGSVGVFPGRVMVTIATKPRSFTIESVRNLATRGAEVVAAVQAQLDAYRANVALSERVEARAQQLATELGQRLGLKCAVERWFRPSHWRAIEARVVGNKRTLARVYPSNNAVRIHAGLVGDDGWDGSERKLDLDAIVAAVTRAEQTLTIDRLVPGHRYRVLRDLADLKKGEVVRFVGFEDIDNHYGIYQFAGPHGRALGVGGDYSTPETSPLGQAHRYLMIVDEG